MDAKEYLSRAFVLNRKIKGKERQLEELKSQVTYSGPLYGDVKVDTNMRHSAVERSALRTVALAQEIEEETAELSSLMDEISRTIRRVGNVEVESVLEMRYLSFMSWEDIAGCLGFSDRHIFRLHRMGLKKVGAYV